jgi:acyl-CoA synthetase (AMP-forming)/AMP-acid ligase II
VEFNLADLFESVVDAVGERTALVCGARRLSYRGLDERANRFANHLLEAGIRPGEHVGMYLYNSTEYVEGMLACLKIRAVPINVNYRYVEDELRYLFADADLVALVHQQEFAPRIAAIRDRVPRLRHLVAVDDASGQDLEALGSVRYDDVLRRASPARTFGPRSPDDLFIIYTGGTTGMPKGVMWRQEDIFFAGMGGGNPLGEPIARPEELAENALRRDPPLCQLVVPPLIHGAAQLGVFIGLFWGDKVVLQPRFDPEDAWDLVERERVTSMTVVGDAMARPLVEALLRPSRPRDLSSLVVLSSAGAVLSEVVKEQFRAVLPQVTILENFGATETGHQGMEALGAPKPASGLRFAMKPTTAVLDDNLEPVRPGSGVVGRVALRGRIPLGYYNDPVKTAQTFVEVRGERWVLPGDLATVDADGTVIVFGRGSVCINSGGEKIFPEEVEAAVKSHPDVYDAVVVGVPDERWGERVAAIVQPREGRAPTLESIQQHCRTRIAGYKMPRELHLVERVLRHPSGKPDYPWARAVATGAVPARQESR